MKDKNYLKAREHLGKAIELLKNSKAVEATDLLTNGDFEQAENLVRKTIALIGTRFALLKVLGEINVKDKENTREALENLGFIFLRNNAYHATMQCFWFMDILLRQQVENKSFKHVTEKYGDYLLNTTFFMDFAIGMHNWFANNFEEAQASFKSAIFRVRNKKPELVKYLEKIILLVEADSKFSSLFEIDEPGRFYEAISEVDCYDRKNNIKDIYEIEDPIAKSLYEVTDVIAGRGFCLIVYAHFLQTISSLLNQLGDVTVDDNLIERIRAKFKINGKNEVVKIGEKFLFAFIAELAIYKHLKDIPKHRFTRLMNVILPLKNIYSKWMESLLIKDTRKNFFEKNLLELNNQIDPLVLLVYEEGISPKYMERTAGYARMWTRESGPDGEGINKMKYDALISSKKQFDITIVANHRKEICLGEKIFHESLKPLHFSILQEAFKNKGNAGDALNLLGGVFGNHATARELAEELGKAMKTKDSIEITDAKTAIRKATGKVRTEISRLNKYINKTMQLRVKLKTEGREDYRFVPALKYLYIELPSLSYKYPSS